MLLYLSSYKLGNKTTYLKEWLKENENKILLILNARDAKIKDDIEKDKINQNIKMLEDIGFEVTILDLKKYFNCSKDLNKELKNYNAFCVIGGNVFVLRQAMKLSGFDKYLIDNLNNEDLLYIGYSAGSCVLAKSLDGLQLVDEPINPYNNDDVIYEGVGVLDYCIAPHYKSNHKESDLIENVVEYMQKNNKNYKTLRDGEVIIEEIK